MSATTRTSATNQQPSGPTTTADPFWPTRNPVGFARHLTYRSAAGSPPRPPGPRGLPVVGVLPQIQRDPFRYVQQLAGQYGDVFRLPMPLYDVVMVNHPDYVAQVMNCRNGEYSMVGPAGPMMRRLFGVAIPGLEGDEFKQRRKLLTPMFGRRHLSDISEVIVEEFVARVDRWKRFADTGETIDLQHEIAFVTMPAFMRAMFSIEITEAENHQLDVDLRTFMGSIAAAFFMGPMPRVLPGGDNLAAAIVRVRRWVNARIEERLADPTPKPDLLQVMLNARYEDGTPVSRRDLVMEMTVLVAGGYETVVAALSWTLALLQQNAEAQQQLLAEVELLGGERPTFADLERLPWAKACFDEGQRLQGHPFHPRFAMTDDVIGGYRIRRGTVVAVPMYTLQRDPRWWGPNPEAYDPNQFYDRSIAAGRPPLAFIPFGAGPHRCLGSALAYMNAQFLLAIIHQRFEIHTPPGWTPTHAATFSTTIQGGLPVTLEKVSTSRPASVAQ